VDTQKPGGDRRRFDRYWVDYPISFNVKDNNEISTGMAMNLSEGGLLVCFFDRFSVGLDSGEKIRLRRLLASMDPDQCYPRSQQIVM